MAVIIEDMEMPTRCTDCDFATVEKDGKTVWRKCGRTGDTCTMHAGHFDRMETCPLRPEQGRKKGDWIEYTKVIVPEPYNKWEQAWKCSECGFDDGFWDWKFCPCCGARMVEI